MPAPTSRRTTSSASARKSSNEEERLPRRYSRPPAASSLCWLPPDVTSGRQRSCASVEFVQCAWVPSTCANIAASAASLAASDAGEKFFPILAAISLTPPVHTSAALMGATLLFNAHRQAFLLCHRTSSRLISAPHCLRLFRQDVPRIRLPFLRPHEHSTAARTYLTAAPFLLSVGLVA